VDVEQTQFTAYLAAEGYREQLLQEAAREGLDVREAREDLVLAAGPPRELAWAQNTWRSPRFIHVESIGKAAKALKALQRNWALYSTGYHRRAALIQEQLPPVSARPLGFGEPAPSAPLGSWTLWDANLVLASPDCSSPFPHGRARFEENKTDPPNRAYLKLWEAFTLLGRAPGPGEVCLDLGASPGGWTWVLAGLGARVVAVDKAPLDSRVQAMEGVECRRSSAFAVDPRHAEPVDWLFSDVVCYPGRLHTYIDRWLRFGRCRNFVCTVKFQAGTDFEAMDRFKALAGSRLMHLWHNKHELTWVKLEGWEAGGVDQTGPAGQ
jgi:23S rRNA (cytidine2498-2'-O)-methyltransferase